MILSLGAWTWLVQPMYSALSLYPGPGRLDLCPDKTLGNAPTGAFSMYSIKGLTLEKRTVRLGQTRSGIITGDFVDIKHISNLEKYQHYFYKILKVKEQGNMLTEAGHQESYNLLELSVATEVNERPSEVMTYSRQYVNGSIFTSPQVWSQISNDDLLVAVYSYVKTYIR